MLPTESISGTENTEERLYQHLLGQTYSVKNDKSWLDKFHHFFLWGHHHLEVLKKRSPLIAERSIVIGHPRYDTLRALLLKEVLV